MISKRDLATDREMIEIFVKLSQEWRHGFQETFLCEITLLRGKLIFDLFAPIDDDVETESLNSAQTQILESQLLSGGIPLHLYAQFSPDKLRMMIRDARAGGPVNDELVQQLEKALVESVDKTMFKKDDEKLFEQVIRPGLNIAIDAVCDGLQLALKKKGGPIASYCTAGQDNGMALTRAAFAVLIKFQGLAQKLRELTDDAQTFDDQSPQLRQAGSARDDALLNLLDDCIFKEDILTCWSNATKMRRWLLHKKQLVSQKLEYQENAQEMEQAEIKDIIEKVVQKAEILTLFQQPKVPFKAEKDNAQISKI